MIIGTSTCHLVIADREQLVRGVAGVVEDGIVAGMFAYEAGQAAVGDSFAWFVDHAGRPRANRGGQSTVSVHDVLSRAQPCGRARAGLVALDWWNGNRATLVDAN